MPHETLTRQTIGHAQQANLADLREQLAAVGADGYAPAVGEAMRAIGCSNEHETMLTLIDALLQRLDRRKVARTA